MRLAGATGAGKGRCAGHRLARGTTPPVSRGLVVRENAYEKGRRYVLEARLLVDHVDGHTIRATCRGGGEIYRLGYDRGGWWCSCPARTTCSHLTALMLVTVRPTG